MGGPYHDFFAQTLTALRFEANRAMLEIPINSSDLEAKRDAYVYVLLRPVPAAWNENARYIGKGTGPRMADHRRKGVNHYNPRLASEYAMWDLHPRKIVTGLTDNQALFVEQHLICWLGLEEEGGLLLNGTYGGESNAPGEATKRRMSDAAKAAHARPEVRERRAASFADPEVRAKRIAAQKAAFSLPGATERRRAAQIEAQNRPDVRERRNAAIKMANMRPEVKERRKASYAAYQTSDEVKARRNAAIKAAHSRPEVRDRYRAAYARSDFKEKMSAIMKAALANPEIRERIGSRTKAAFARRRNAAGMPDIYSADSRAAIRASHRAGVSIAELQIRYATSYWTIKNILKEQEGAAQ